jgi:hypothetical protein
MVSSWLKPKLIKLKRQRRAWARPLSVKSGIQPSREVIRQYQDTAKGLGREIAEVRFPNVAAGRHELMLRYKTPGDPLRGIIDDIRDPFFVTLVENSRQRCRIYYNSGMTCYIIQWADYRKNKVHLSITYPSSARAIDVWMTGKVIWKKEFDLRKG